MCIINDRVSISLDSLARFFSAPEKVLNKGAYAANHLNDMPGISPWLADSVANRLYGDSLPTKEDDVDVIIESMQAALHRGNFYKIGVEDSFSFDCTLDDHTACLVAMKKDNHIEIESMGGGCIVLEEIHDIEDLKPKINIYLANKQVLKNMGNDNALMKEECHVMFADYVRFKAVIAQDPTFNANDAVDVGERFNKFAMENSDVQETIRQIFNGDTQQNKNKHAAFLGYCFPPIGASASSNDDRYLGRVIDCFYNASKLEPTSKPASKLSIFDGGICDYLEFS